MYSYKNLIKQCLIIIIFIITIADIEAQTRFIDVSISIPKIKDKYYGFENNMYKLQINYCHEILDNYALGVYSGIGIYEEWYGMRDEEGIELEYNLNHPLSLHYGINGYFDLMPLLLKTNIPRFDFYLSGKAGVISLFSSSGENIIPQRGNYFDYSIMLGSTLYLSKKMGLNTEIGYKNFKYHKGFNALFGLRFRF